jgi:serine carboxypeptidase-like clade II
VSRGAERQQPPTPFLAPQVDPAHWRRLFYWHVVSEEANAPLVMWLNGGPGCSSLGGGLMEENGPWQPVPGKGTNVTLQANPWSWHNVANMIYVESPAGVGFSFSDDKADYTVGDNRTALDLWSFMQGFLAEYPQYVNTPFYISGESYGGHYLPTFAWEIVQMNEAIKKGTVNGQLINFQGFLVGNAWTDATIDNRGAADWWYSHVFISQDTYVGMTTLCNFSDVGPLVDARARGDESFGPFAPIVDPATGEAVRDAAGLTCNDYVNQAGTEQGNAFNIYEFDAFVCLDGDTGQMRLPNHVHHFLRAMGRLPADAPRSRNLADVRADGAQAASNDHDDADSNMPSGAAAFYQPCIDNYVYNYLNTPAVQVAIHANTSLGYPWEDCSSIINYSYQDLLSSMLPIYQDLLAYGKLRILVYSGTHDAIVPTSGTLAWLDVLNLPVRNPFRAWYTSNGQTGGWTVDYQGGLSFATVRNAGHLVPNVQPSRALHLVRSFLQGKDL